jgi:hypothetical protein
MGDRWGAMSKLSSDFPERIAMAAAAADSGMSSNHLQGAGILLRTIRKGDGASFPERGDLCVVRIFQ